MQITSDKTFLEQFSPQVHKKHTWAVVLFSPGNESISHQNGAKENYRLKSAFLGGYVTFWLVVSTHLKSISQMGSFPQVGVKIKNIWNHHPAFLEGNRFSNSNSIGLIRSPYSVKTHQQALEVHNARWSSTPQPFPPCGAHVTHALCTKCTSKIAVHTTNIKRNVIRWFLGNL